MKTSRKYKSCFLNLYYLCRKGEKALKQKRSVTPVIWLMAVVAVVVFIGAARAGLFSREAQVHSRAVATSRPSIAVVVPLRPLKRGEHTLNSQKDLENYLNFLRTTLTQAKDKMPEPKSGKAVAKIDDLTIKTPTGWMVYTVKIKISADAEFANRVEASLNTVRQTITAYLTGKPLPTTPPPASLSDPRLQTF